MDFWVNALLKLGSKFVIIGFAVLAVLAVARNAPAPYKPNSYAVDPLALPRLRFKQMAVGLLIVGLAMLMFSFRIAKVAPRPIDRAMSYGAAVQTTRSRSNVPTPFVRKEGKRTMGWWSGLTSSLGSDLLVGGLGLCGFAVVVRYSLRVSEEVDDDAVPKSKLALALTVSGCAAIVVAPLLIAIGFHLAVSGP